MTTEQIAGQGAQTKAVVQTGFQLSGFMVQTNLEGISDEESRSHPIPGAASMNWVLGHILTIRQLILSQLGVEGSFAGPEEFQDYMRGASGRLTPEQGLAFEDLVTRFRAAQERMMAKIAELSEEEMGQSVTIPVPAPHPGPLAELLTLLMLHDSYHAGQLGILRRGLGKEGAIR